MPCGSEPNTLCASTLFDQRLTQQELSSINALVDDELTQSFARFETPEFADARSLSAQQLPRRFCQLAHRFKYLHLSCSALLPRGVQVGDKQLGSDSTFVVMICDGGEKYLDTVFNDEWMREHELLDATVAEELDQCIEEMAVPA